MKITFGTPNMEMLLEHFTKNQAYTQRIYQLQAFTQKKSNILRLFMEKNLVDAR